MNGRMVVLALALLAGACATSTDPAQAVPSRAMTPTSAADYQRMFNAKSDWTWSGGDQAVSVPGPGGDIYWLFQDTLIGVPDPDGTYPANVGMLPNTILLQRGGDLLPTTIGAAIRSEADGSKYWPLSGYYRAADKRLIVLAYKIAGGANPTMANLGTRVVSMAVNANGTLTLAGIYPTPATSGNPALASWGTSSYLHSDGYVYIYGSSDNPDPNEWGRRVQAARVPTMQVATPSAWRFWNGSTWASTPSTAAASYIGQTWSTGASLHYRPGSPAATRWLVVTKEHEFLGTEVVAFTSANVTGPWTKTVLFESVSTADESTYSAYAHPELPMTGGGILVSICHNRAGATNWANEPADLYKPEFREVVIP